MLTLINSSIEFNSSNGYSKFHVFESGSRPIYTLYKINRLPLAYPFNYEATISLSFLNCSSFPIDFIVISPNFAFYYFLFYLNLNLHSYFLDYFIFSLCLCFLGIPSSFLGCISDKGIWCWSYLMIWIVFPTFLMLTFLNRWLNCYIFK